MSRMLIHSAHILSPRESQSAFSFASLNTTAARIAIVCSVVILGAVYLWVMNSSTSAGFELSQLERQRVALESEYTRLQEQEVALRSLDHVSQESQEMNMVAQTAPTYIDRNAQQVAAR